MTELQLAITTPRGLELELLQLGHAQQLWKLLNNNKDHLSHWLPWVESTQKVLDTRDYIEEGLYRYTKGRAMNMGIFEQGTLVGSISFTQINQDHHKATIGYWICKDHEGRGIVREACHTIIDYGFSHFHLRRQEILCATDNVRAQKIPEKLGFTKEGTMRSYVYVNHQPIDVIMYSMLDSEWKEKKGKEPFMATPF